MNREERVMKVNEYTTEAWENAFATFVEGEEVHGKEAVERAIKIMNAIDKDFTATLVTAETKEEILEVAPVAVEVIEETPEQKSHRFMIARELRTIERDGKTGVRKIEVAHELKRILESEGKTIKIRSHFGRLFIVTVIGVVANA